MRKVLPNRRPNETVTFDVGQMRYKATLGYYLNADLEMRLGEVFLNAGKLDTDADVAAKEAAIAVSFAIQYGCPVDTIAAAFPRRPDGTPEGPLGTLFDKLGAEQ